VLIALFAATGCLCAERLVLLLSPGERVVEDPTSIKAGRGERKRAVGTKPPLSTYSLLAGRGINAAAMSALGAGVGCLAEGLLQRL